MSCQSLFQEKVCFRRFSRIKYLFRDTKTYLVKMITEYYLNNLCQNNKSIRFSAKFKFFLK